MCLYVYRHEHIYVYTYTYAVVGAHSLSSPCVIFVSSFAAVAGWRFKKKRSGAVCNTHTRTGTPMRNHVLFFHSGFREEGALPK